MRRRTKTFSITSTFSKRSIEDSKPRNGVTSSRMKKSNGVYHGGLESKMDDPPAAAYALCSGLFFALW